ncbi:hypothetical protein SUGI_1103710 [Cryptomeria japonica]|nr:hypothetical protein SUGI_1103710 [Cryptomeria japonica]
MKFGKEFVAQMVHEWHEAYMDYNFLKTMLKDIIRHKARPKPKPIPNAINPPSGGIKRAMTFRSFSGLLRRDSISEEEIIVVKSQEEDGNDSIETMFSRTAEQGTEYEVLFFKRLDEELNRVNRFYRGRVEEIVKEAAELNKQISSLVACKYIVRNKPGQELENSDIAGNTPPNPEKRSGPVHMEEINDVRLRITPNTPPCTILSIPDSPDKKTLYKRDLRRANKMVRTACIAFYQKLTLLKSYSSLNLLAFSKIMKKYDKVNTLLKRVEEMFTKHFATGIHSKAVKILRPTRKRKRHSLTFFIGFFTGCSMALLVALILLVVVQNVYNDKEASRFMESVFPLYSMLGFIFVHMFMYGADLYFWQYFRINYPFIFEFNWGTELGFRELFLIATALSVMTLSGAILNLNLGTKSLSIPGDFVPLTLVVVLLLALFLPFKILYQSSRLFLLRTALHCIFVPFYKVSLPDFFLADQLTSQDPIWDEVTFDPNIVLVLKNSVYMEDDIDGVDDMTDLSMHVSDLEHRHSDLVDLESQFIVEGDKEEAQEEYDRALCPQRSEKVILEQKNVWVEHDSDSNQQVDSLLFDTNPDWTFINPLFKFDVGIPFDFSDEGGSHCRVWDLGRFGEATFRVMAPLDTLGRYVVEFGCELCRLYFLLPKLVIDSGIVDIDYSALWA